MRERRYRVGEKVCFQLGIRTVQGYVKEDRGPIGVKGRHLYLVEFKRDESPAYVELPAVEMEPVEDTVATD